MTQKRKKGEYRVTKKHKKSSSEEMVWAIVHEGSPGGRSETTGGYDL